MGTLFQEAIGALIIRVGFGGILQYNYSKEPANPSGFDVMAASKAEDFRPRGQSFPIPTTLWPKLVSLRLGWGNLRCRISAVQAKPAEKWISTMDVSRPKKKQA